MHPEFALGQAHAQGLTDANVCQFEDCDCPGGPSHFDSAEPKWRPTVDRIVMGKHGGEYVPENVRRMHKRCNVRLSNRDPEHVRRVTELGRANLVRINADPEQRRMRAVRCADPEFQKLNREHLARLHADPEQQRIRSEQLARLHASPEHKERMARMDRTANGRKGACTTNRIRKGLPCTCGQHETASTAV